MAKSSAMSMALFVAAIAYYALLATLPAGGNGVHAFQASYRQLNNAAVAVSSSIATTCGGGSILFSSLQSHPHQKQHRHRRCRQSISSIEMKARLSDINYFMDHEQTSSSPSSNIVLPSHSSSSFLFPSSTHQPPRPRRRMLRRIRRKFTTLFASLAFFLSLLSPAHASSSSSATTLASNPYPTTTTAAAVTAVTATTKSLDWQRLNPFRTQSTDEMIDAYVKSKLFDDDVFDPVESAYREAISDHHSGSSSSSSSVIGKKRKKGGSDEIIEGAYPTLLAETVKTALGQQQHHHSVSSTSSMRMLSKSNANNKDVMKSDSLTSLLIQASDMLQTKLGVSASTSYSIVAAVGIVGICVVPAGLGVVYQSIQRMQIDRSEMKMYGKIADLDATSKRVNDDDDDDDDDEDE